MVSNMNNMKKLVGSKTVSGNFKYENNGVTAVMPLHPSPTSSQIVRKPGMIQVVIAKTSRVAHALFFVWGILILVFHIHAESVPELPQCKMQVKPWLSSLPSCSLFVLDCYASNISGTESEITLQWNSFNPATTAYVTIRHCPNLEIHSQFTEFSQMKVLKFYNKLTTIISWQKNAAISEASHPNLLMVFLMRVNMTNGELPAGFHANRLPETLRDIEFCITNLQILPEDFDLKWPKSASIYFEASNLTEIPLSLVRLAPFHLSLALNPILNIPAALIQGNIGFLNVGGTLISELPEVVNDVSPSFNIRVDSTNVSFFWEWIDVIVATSDAQNMAPILAANSPYCLDAFLDKSKQISRAHNMKSKMLSDASVENWDTLKKTVSSNESPTMYYSIEFEDAVSGLKSS